MNKLLKHPSNLSVDEGLLQEARALHIDVSQAAEQGLTKAIAEEKSRRWLAENREALDSSNAYVEKHGLPLARHRLF